MIDVAAAVVCAVMLAVLLYLPRRWAAAVARERAALDAAQRATRIRQDRQALRRLPPGVTPEEVWEAAARDGVRVADAAHAIVSRRLHARLEQIVRYRRRTEESTR